MKLFLPIVCLVGLTTALHVSRTADWPRVTGIYSTMAVSGRSGDASGFEIFVLHGVDTGFVMIQIAEGAPSDPVLVPAALTDTSLSFDLSQTALASLGRFKGRLTKELLTGKFHDGTQITLPRRNSFWQR